MEINLMILITTILLLATSIDSAEQDFIDYIDAYEGEGWSDPYSSTCDCPVCNNTGEPPEDPVDPVEGDTMIIATDVQIHSQDTINKLGLFVNWVNGNDIDVVYLLGDQVDDENKDWQLDELLDGLQRLTIPYYVMKGNHEGRKVDLWDHNDKLVHVINNSCMVLMNSYNEGKTHGYWRDDQVSWIDDTLDLYRGHCDHFVIMSHHAIYDPTYPSPNNAMNIKAIMESYLTDYDTIVHFRGHNDYYEVDRTNGIDYITVPSVRHMTDRDNPLGIRYHPDTAEYDLCWTGKDCESQ